MAVRPLAFGARLRHSGRTLRVSRGYVVEDSDPRRATQHRDHLALDGALRDLAKTWLARLH